MYAFFKGKVDNILNDRIIIDVNNVGYEIMIPESSLFFFFFKYVNSIY